MATAVRKLSRNNKSRSKRSGSSGGGASRAIGLLLALILVGGGVYAYMNPEIIEQAKAMVGLAEPADEGNMGGNGAAAQQAPAAPTITDPKAVEALNMAKVWVETRLAKGTRLNEINEALPSAKARLPLFRPAALPTVRFCCCRCNRKAS